MEAADAPIEQIRYSRQQIKRLQQELAWLDNRDQ